MMMAMTYSDDCYNCGVRYMMVAVTSVMAMMMVMTLMIVMMVAMTLCL